MKIKFKYGEFDNCTLGFGKYYNGTHAMKIYDSEGQPLINVTKALPGFFIGGNEVLVKDYSENEGILECLTNLGIIEPTGETLPAGYARLHLCKLLIDPETYEQ